IACVVEEPARAGRLDDVLEDGHREMRLPDARLSLQQESAVDDGKCFGDAARLSHGAVERLVIRREVREAAVLVPLGDVRFREPLPADVLAPAVATDHAARAALVDGSPAGVVAESARHYSILLAGRAGRAGTSPAFPAFPAH